MYSYQRAPQISFRIQIIKYTILQQATVVTFHFSLNPIFAAQ